MGWDTEPQAYFDLLVKDPAKRHCCKPDQMSGGKNREQGIAQERSESQYDLDIPTHMYSPKNPEFFSANMGSSNMKPTC